MITRLQDLVNKIPRIPVKGATSEGSLSRFTISGSISITKTLESGYYGLSLYNGTAPKELEVDTSSLDDLIKECDPVLLIEVKKRAEQVMSEKFPVYYEFYQSCIIVEDDSCETAYIMFNEILSEYEIHYSPKFILEKMLIDASIWNEDDVEMSIIKSFLFVFMHEMMHALRYHMANQASAVSKTNPTIINIMGDSFINTELQQVLNVPILYNCIDSKVTFKGKLNRNLNVHTLTKELKTWYTALSGKTVSTSDDPDVEPLKRGEQVTITIFVSDKGQEILFGKNSNLYIMELDRFLQKFFMVESAESGSGKGKESSEHGGISDSESQSTDQSGSDSSNTSSSAGDSDDYTDDEDDSDGDGESSSSGSSSSSSLKDSQTGQASGSSNSDSSGQGSGGTPGSSQQRATADDSLASAAAVQKARSNLEEAIQKVSNSKTETEGTAGDSLLKSIGADKLARNYKNVQTWKAKLNKYLTDCLSTTEKYNSELANARIEGQYGREEDVNVPKRIILAFDCSGSMGPEKFKQVMGEVENFLLANKYKRIEIIVIYWGSYTPEAIKMKLNKGLVQKIIASSKSLGGTDMYTCLDLVKEKYRKFDMMIIFTDGEIESTPKEDSKAFLRRVSSRVLYVLTKGGYSKYILNYDSGAKRRIIQAK